MKKTITTLILGAVQSTSFGLTMDPTIDSQRYCDHDVLCEIEQAESYKLILEYAGTYGEDDEDLDYCLKYYPVLTEIEHCLRTSDGLDE